MSGKFKYLLILGLLLGIVQSYAQQYPVFTQYYFNELVINPAYAGSHVQLSLTAMYRNQWVNFPGAPKTYNISGHSSFKKKRMGFGFMINHDEIGSYKNEHIYFSYAYKILFPKSTLSMGIQAGFNLLSARYKLDLQNIDDPSFLNSINTIKPNFGAGLYYNRKNFFVGISIPFIINNTIASSVQQNLLNGIKEARYYYLRSGFVKTIDRNKNVKINPSVLVRTQEGQPLAVDFNCAFIFYDVFGAGISYRTSDSFITFIDLQMTEQMHFAYSYDWTTSSINRFAAGSHEFMLNYRFKISSVHKNLECPKYYEYR
ncbi:MAG TPA: type IX secretion system membrane protein PorP/SprF [Cyclobacteriaceae bacterium]|nr:type IX secretion system membrane protein PorP/SprF [Cyclobacteriaceae bacterium]